SLCRASLVKAFLLSLIIRSSILNTSRNNTFVFDESELNGMAKAAKGVLLLKAQLAQSMRLSVSSKSLLSRLLENSKSEPKRLELALQPIRPGVKALKP